MDSFDSINQKLDPERDQLLDELFKDVPAQAEITLDFPSNGKFYRNFAKAILRPVTFEDEKFMIASQSPDAVNILIERCLKGLNVKDLLILDKMYVLLKLREISYGAEYQAQVTCPHCSSKADVKIDISKLNINHIPDTLEDPKTIMLPVLKKKISVKLPRVSDEIYLKSGESVYSNIWRFVIAIDSITDPVTINKAVQRMNIRDVRTIISQLSSKEAGVDPRFLLQCADCGAESEMAVPITDDFFSQI